MNTRFTQSLAALLLAMSLAHQARGQNSTTFTYQGQLTDWITGSPLTGLYDFRFRLYDDDGTPGRLGNPLPLGAPIMVTTNVVPVTNGLFTVRLDFTRAPFDGPPRWLEIDVRQGAAAYRTLAERTELTPIPYAIYAQTAGTVTNAAIGNAQLAPNAVAAANLQANSVAADKIDFHQVVKSLDGLKDDVTLSAGANVTLATNANNLTINATGGPFSVNGNSVYYNAGNVGIGTDSPQGALDINVFDTTFSGLGIDDVYNRIPCLHPPCIEVLTGSYYFRARRLNLIGNDYTTQFIVRGDGRVGIGTANPSAALDVQGNLLIGTGINNQNHKLIIRGPNSPGDANSFQDLSYEFANAGSAKVRAFRGSSWDTYLQLLTTDAAAGSDNPQVRLQIGGDGRAFIYSKLDVEGDVGCWSLTTTSNASVGSLCIRGGADLAEPFEMSGREIPKGSLVIIDEENPGQLKLATQAYDTRVAGIVSGANGVNPGISLHQAGVIEGGQNVALSGRVYARADASSGSIKPGDLLTSSSTPGHVMKAADPKRAQGAVVGKAMSPLKEGQGMVLVLVSLQ